MKFWRTSVERGQQSHRSDCRRQLCRCSGMGVIFGLALRGAGEVTKDVLGNITDGLSVAIRWVINCAPFGILGLVFTTLSTTGIKAFASYGKIILVLVGCMLFVAFVVNPILVFLNIRQNPYPLVLTCIKDSGIMAFFTRVRRPIFR